MHQALLPPRKSCGNPIETEFQTTTRNLDYCHRVVLIEYLTTKSLDSSSILSEFEDWADVSNPGQHSDTIVQSGVSSHKQLLSQSKLGTDYRRPLYITPMCPESKYPYFFAFFGHVFCKNCIF